MLNIKSILIYENIHGDKKYIKDLIEFLPQNFIKKVWPVKNRLQIIDLTYYSLKHNLQSCSDDY